MICEQQNVKGREERKKHFSHINKWIVGMRIFFHGGVEKYKEGREISLTKDVQEWKNSKALSSEQRRKRRKIMICSLVDSRWCSCASCVSSTKKKCISMYIYTPSKQWEGEKKTFPYCCRRRRLRLSGSRVGRKWKEQNSIKNVIMTVIAKINFIFPLLVIIVEWNESFLYFFIVFYIFYSTQRCARCFITRINWRNLRFFVIFSLHFSTNENFVITSFISFFSIIQQSVNWVNFNDFFSVELAVSNEIKLTQWVFNF